MRILGNCFIICLGRDKNFHAAETRHFGVCFSLLREEQPKVWAGLTRSQKKTG